MNNKTEKITIRFAPEEYRTIHENSQLLNIKKSTYCRDAIFNTTVTCKKPSLALLRELNSIGNNINQISRYINIHKIIDITVLHLLDSIEIDLTLIKDSYVA